MIGSVFIASLRHNDNGMLNMSGLNSYLISLLRELVLINGQFPALYGDGIFQILATILPRFRLQRALTADELAFFKFLNRRYSSLRQCIEHIFGQHRNICGIFDSRTRFSLFLQREHAVRFILMSYFVLNSYHCFRGNGTSVKFGVPTPKIWEYLPLDEDLPPRCIKHGGYI